MRVLVVIIACVTVFGCTRTAKDSLTSQEASSAEGANVTSSTENGITSDSASGNTNGKQDILEETVLRIRFRKGEKIVRELKVTMIIGDVKNEDNADAANISNITLKWIYAAEILDVRNSVATVRLSTTPIETTEGFYPAQTTVVEIDDRGRVLSEISGFIAGVLGLGLIGFPEEKIGPGSAWTQSTVRKIPMMMNEIDMEVEERYSYVGLVTEDNQVLRRIDLSATGSHTEYSSEGSYYYDAETGWLVKADITLSVKMPLPTSKDGPPVKITTSITVRPS